MSAGYLRLYQHQALYLLKFAIAELADTYPETVVLYVWLTSVAVPPISHL